MSAKNYLIVGAVTLACASAFGSSAIASGPRTDTPVFHGFAGQNQKCDGRIQTCLGMRLALLDPPKDIAYLLRAPVQVPKVAQSKQTASDVVDTTKNNLAELSDSRETTK